MWTIYNDSKSCSLATSYKIALKLTGCSDEEFTCSDGLGMTMINMIINKIVMIILMTTINTIINKIVMIMLMTMINTIINKIVMIILITMINTIIKKILMIILILISSGHACT